jgi:hypothetical protein
MAKPMFFYVGVYDSANDAKADDDAIKALHDAGAIGSYDSAITSEEPTGTSVSRRPRSLSSMAPGSVWRPAPPCVSCFRRRFPPLSPGGARAQDSAPGSPTSPTAPAAVKPRGSARP